MVKYIGNYRKIFSNDIYNFFLSKLFGRNIIELYILLVMERVLSG